MPRYTYKCDTCNIDYVEIRNEEENPHFFNCKCGQPYTEVK